MRKLVIIPTYNEKENISAMISKVFSLEEPFEMLVIDDGSPDGTAAIVRERQKEFPETLHLLERSGKQGLGTAYLTGFRWGLEHGFDYICEMDCDFSHNPDDLVRLYRTAAEGYDVVVGSRYVEGVNVIHWPMSRLLMSYFASVYVRTVTRMPLHDATAGFVCYSRRALETMDLDAIRMKGYGFQIEMKYTAWRLGLKLREVSIVFVERREGVSKMSGGIFREAFFGVLGLPLRRIRKREEPRIRNIPLFFLSIIAILFSIFINAVVVYGTDNGDLIINFSLDFAGVRVADARIFFRIFCGAAAGALSLTFFRGCVKI